jgi:hypothetical protein
MLYKYLVRFGQLTKPNSAVRQGPVRNSICLRVHLQEREHSKVDKE